MDLKLLIFYLAVLCVILISKVSSQGKCPPLVEYMYSFDYALDEHVVEKFNLLREDWCLAKCNLNKRCRSVNYNRKLSSSDNCELNSATNQQYPKSYNLRPGWVYYENKFADTLPPVVDGGWGDWGIWASDCPTNCLGERKRTRSRFRTRTCTNPAPLGGGNDCSGQNTDRRICGIPGCFELLQTFRTTGGNAVTSFEIKNEFFFAFTNYRNSNGGYKPKLPVYVLQQNNFTLNQTLDTISATDVKYFTIHGDHFLSVANQYDGISYEHDSVLYRWEAGKFKEFQRIPTNHVRDTHYFTIRTRKFLSFSNYGSYQVSIYEWENEKFSNKIQDIQITKPWRCNTFTIQNITYIACGRQVITGDSTTILKWSGKQFEPFQDLPSSYVLGRPHSFLANGTVYLAITNYYKLGNNYDTDSFIYRWNGTMFVHHQSIPTYGARGSDSFTTAQGEVFLVVANHYTQSSAKYKVNSAVYKMAVNKFNLYQHLPTTGVVYVHAFAHEGKQYLSFVNNNDGYGYHLDSPVYIWN